MVPRPRLVVIGASPNIATTARGIDPRTVFVQQPGSPVTRIVDTLSNLYSLDFADRKVFESFVRVVLRPLGVAAVVSVTETGQEPAALANEILGTPGVPLEVVARFNDKVLMRRRLAERAPELSCGYALVTSSAEAADAVGRWGEGARLVLKPATGTASRGVTLLDGPGGLDGFDGFDDLSGADGPVPYLLEEYLPGREFSAEMFSRNGVHRLIAVTEKHVFDSTFVESAHVVPATGIDSADMSAIEHAMCVFLDAMELRDGPTHTEFKLADGRVRIIESHTRIGGDGIGDLVRLAAGVDVKRLALGWSVGVTESDCTQPPAAAAAAVAFVTARPGRVTRVAPPALDEDQGVDVVSIEIAVQPGEAVGELTESARRVGRVMTTGADPRTVLDATRGLAARVTVETQP